MVPKDFDELADWLVRASSAFSPSELHGAVVGGLSGSMRLSQKEWSLFGLAIMGASEQAHASDQYQAEAVLGGLATEQLELLAGNDMSFAPYLPDDDCDIEQRTEALSHWCKGFLGGFAEAQVKAKRAGTASGDEPLPENVVEALRDIAAIAQATLDTRSDYDEELDDDPLAIDDIMDAQAGLLEDEESLEEQERDYLEIVEYLRLAALTIFTEYGWVEAASPPKGAAPQSPVGSQNRTLH